jgi:alpha-1,2-mannosyltransferase
MPRRLTRRFYEIGALGVAAAILAVMAWRLIGLDGLLLASDQPLFGDFIAFWSAGRAALDGHADRVHDPVLINAYQDALIPHMHVMAPWNSPPPFLLIASALALMPYPVAAMAFLASTGALYLTAARKLLPDARALIFAATAPAALFHIGSIQTGLIIAGVTGLALYWRDRRPLAAGALIGLLAIKPHLAILWPLYLALSGRWRMFGAAAASTLLFCLAAGAAFGFETFPNFIANLSTTEDLISYQRVARETYASLYGNLVGLGAPHALALGAHAISALAALTLACVLFRRDAFAASGAALCAATMLASPYLFFYDSTLLAIGAALLGAPRNRFELLALIAAWGSGLSLALGYFISLPVCPLGAWLLLIAAFRRAESAAAHPAPAQRM